MSINRYRLKHLTSEKNRAAMRVDKLLNRPDRLIGLILIGNNLVNIAATVIAAEICNRLYGDTWGPLIATISLTLVILVFAEVTPKTLAAIYPERVAFPSSILLLPLLTLMKPFVYAITTTALRQADRCN